MPDAIRLPPHVRGTHLVFSGYVEKAGSVKNLTDGSTLHFRVYSISPDDGALTVISSLNRNNGDSGVTVAATGKYTVTYEPSVTLKTGAMGADAEYWVDCHVVDVETGKRWCVARALLPLADSDNHN